MSDFFKRDKAHKNKNIKERIENHVLYEDTNPELYFVVDTILTQPSIQSLKNLLRRLRKESISFSIIYCFDNKYEKSAVDKNIKAHTIKHAIDFTRYIPPGSKIIAMGRGMYALTKDTTMQLNTFQDLVWNDTKFYHPETRSWVYPTEGLFQIYRYGSEDLQDNFDRFHFNHQINRALDDDLPSVRVPKLKVEIVEDPNKFLEDNMGREKLAWDLETSGLDAHRDSVHCITMSFDGRTGYYLRWKDVDQDLLNRFFKGKFQIGANLKFDCRFLRALGIDNAMPDFDTLHAGHVLNEMRSNSLKTHAWVYTYYGGYDLPLEEYKMKYPKTARNYTLFPEVLISDYATKDSILTYQVYEAQLKHLDQDPAVRNYFYEHVMPTVQMFVEIESEGVYINWDNVKEQYTELDKERQRLRSEIIAEAGEDFNVDSTAQLGIMLEKLGLPRPAPDKKDLVVEDKDKKKPYSTKEENLLEWKKSGYKIADLLLQYRGYNSLLNTFVGEEEKGSAYWGYRAPDGKIYPGFQVMLANSHRNKAHSPNLQQVPHHGDKAWRIRSFFDVPSEDYFISEFDYSGLQLRIAAIMSEDPNMKKVFTEMGGDLHSMTAQSVFTPNVSLEEFLAKKKDEPYDDYRFQAKGINFGYLFGMAATTYTESYIRKDWSVEKCREFIKEHDLKYIRTRDEKADVDFHLTVGKYMRDSFFNTYAKLVDWHKAQHEFAKKNGYIRSVHGARRLLPQMLHPGEDHKIEANLKNISINSPVQNFEIVMISRAMRELHAYFKENSLKSRMWATVHDAIAFYIHKDEVDLLQKKIPEVMEKTFEEYAGIPIEVEGDLASPRDTEEQSYWGYGKNWYS